MSSSPCPSSTARANCASHTGGRAAWTRAVVSGEVEAERRFLEDRLGHSSKHERRGRVERHEAAGFDSIYLYTHETMTENPALYTRIGYVEMRRGRVAEAYLVYLRKRLW